MHAAAALVCTSKGTVDDLACDHSVMGRGRKVIPSRELQKEIQTQSLVGLKST